MINKKPNDMESTTEDEIDLIDILRVLWNNKVIIITSTILLASIGLIYSFLQSPVYQSNVKIALGNTGHDLYTQPASVQQVIMSRDMMEDVIDRFNLENVRPDELTQKFSVKPIGNTRLIEVEVKANSPELAHEIAKYVRVKFIEASQYRYLEKRQLVEELYQQILKRYEQTGNSLAYNKQTLTDIETNMNIDPGEKALTRARLLDYIIKDENSLASLEHQIREIQVRLLDMQGAEVFEKANLPEYPIAPNKKLNLAISIVIGGMIGVFLAFIIEYLKNNPINLRKDKENTKL